MRVGPALPTMAEPSPSAVGGDQVGEPFIVSRTSAAKDPSAPYGDYLGRGRCGECRLPVARSWIPPFAEELRTLKIWDRGNARHNK